MNNQEKKYELVKFEDGDFSLDVNVSPEENTVWLSNEQMGNLFNRNKTVIVKHIRNIYDEGVLDVTPTSANFAQVQIEGNRKINRQIKIYNLDVIMQVGLRTKSPRTNIFYKWALTILDQLRSKNGSTKPLIVFKHNEITLDVTVSPDEDTVWLTKDQITLLYETTRQNVEYHVNNIYTQKELEEWATCKEILQVQNEKNRLVTRAVNIYNLDMIISLGYRINSKNAIIFRKWATSVLKEYLLKGHVINEERCLTCASNIMSLQNEVKGIESKIKNIENDIYLDNSKAFFAGDIVEPYTFLRHIFFFAKKELTIIDYYADNFLLSMLKDIKVKITIVTSSSSYLNKEILSDNINIIYNNEIHGRYIFIDDKYAYAIDNSFNNIGKKQLIIMRLLNITKEMMLKEKV